MANSHINYATFKSRFGDLGITEWTKYNYLSNYNFGLPAQTVPSDYLELEWLRSVNTTRGYIDTQYVGKDNTSIELDITIYENTNRNLIGNIMASGSPFKGMVLNTYSATELEYLYRNSGWHIIQPQQVFYEKRSKIEYSQKGIYFNGSQIIDLSDVRGNIGNGSFFLFSRNRSDISDTTIADAAIYNLKFYEGSELVRDFHPVKRLSDGQLGLYDTKTGTFVPGTGSFTAGPMKQRYVRVEYVEFHGDSRVGTGVLTGEGTWTQDADIQFTVVDNKSRYNGADSGYYWGIFDGALCFAQTRGAPLSPNKPADTLRHHFISKITHGQQYNTLYIDNVPYTSDRQSTDYGRGLELCIGGVGNSYTYEKVYSYKILKDGILLRNFVPVYDLRDQKYGLYDLVEGKFYASVNNKLTGPFTGCIYLNGLTWTQSTFIDYAWYATAGVTYHKDKINEFLLVSPFYHYIGSAGGTIHLKGTDKAVAVYNETGAYEVYYSNQDGEGSLIGTYLLYK